MRNSGFVKPPFSAQRVMMSFGLPPEFFARLGYYVVLAGHIEHTLHEMLPGWRSGLLD